MTPLSESGIEQPARAGRRTVRPGAPARTAVPGAPAPVDVLATLGHELRTPLATLRATLELLADLPPVGADAERRELLPRLERSVGWLERLVDNLTTVALVQSGNLPLRRRPLALDEALSAAVGLLQPLLERRGQRVIVRCPAPTPWVSADPTWIGQVLVNLLANASAYSPPGAEIALTVSVAPGCVEIRVRDQGPGIPRCEQGRIFRPYARGRVGREARGSGLGLGLHIVRTLVELHDGTVGVRSVPGQGAAFWFRLPTTSPSSDQAPSHPSSEKAS
jgi:signal transduction histidine kinase